MFSAYLCNTELPAVERGYVNGENHVYSHEYKVVCDPGYEPAGSPVAVCDANGAWKTVTTCLGIDINNIKIFNTLLTVIFLTWYGYIIGLHLVHNCKFLF